MAYIEFMYIVQYTRKSFVMVLIYILYNLLFMYKIRYLL